MFLSYHARDRAAAEGLARWLRDQGLSPFLDRWYLAPGVPWPQALESALGACHAVAVVVGPGDMGPWQQREVYLALERQTREPYPVIPVLLPGSQPPFGFLGQNTWIDLRHHLEDPTQLAILKKAILRSPLGPDAQHEAGAQVLAICPYLGLRPFREEDAPLFFGREEFSAALVERVRSVPLVTIIGPSGSGKSSLVQAGLLPVLRRERPPRATWDTITCRPGSHPFHRLAAALVAAWETDLPETDRLIQAEKLGNELAGGAVTAARALEFFLDKARGTDRVLLIVDQFEELFTLTPPAERGRFARALLEVVDAGRVTAILTVRGDFYNHTIGIDRELSRRLAAGIVNVGPMRREELRRAVEKPAETVGLIFEPGLVDRILDHVEGEPGRLPLLEFALTELWARRRGHRLEHEQYQALGQVDGAIGKRAADVFRGLASDGQTAARRLMTRLVRLVAAGEESSDTRQRVNLADLDERARTVVPPFADARLLVVGRDEASGHETVELAHEALIRSWPELKDGLEADRAFLLWRQRLNLLRGEWQRSSRDEALLLRGAQLVEATRRARERGEDLSPAEREFIAQSERKARRPRRLAISVVVAASIAAVAGGLWLAWTRTDAYQIRVIRAAAPRLVARVMANRQHVYVVDDFLRTLAEMGYPADARTAAGAIASVPWRVRMLGTVAHALAQGGRAAEAGHAEADARAAARSIPDAGTRSRALSVLAVALARGHMRPQAIDAAAEAHVAADAIVDERADRARALLVLAVARRTVGPADEAKRVLASALETARAVEDPGHRAQALAELIPVLTWAGEARGATAARAAAGAAAAQIERPRDREEAVLRLRQPTDRLGSTTRRREELREELAKLVAKARAKVAARNPDFEARVAIEDALEMSDTGEEVEGIVADAYRVAGEIDDPSERARFLAVIGRSLLRVGRRGEAVNPLLEARAASMRIADPRGRSDALHRIAAALLHAGRPDTTRTVLADALAAARQIQEPDGRSDALRSHLEGLVATDDVQAVKQTALELVNLVDLVEPSRRAGLVTSAAEALARVGLYRQARTMVAAAEADDQLRTYAAILEAFARRRDPNVVRPPDPVGRKAASRRGEFLDDAPDDLDQYLEFDVARWR